MDADGDPTAQTTPDTEISEDNAAATDAAEEVSATSGMDGVGLITFTGAETDCSCLAVNYKATSGPKATLMFLYPRVLAVVGSGTLSAGSSGGGTLGTLLQYDVTGCFIRTTGGTGGGGTGGANNQARKIVTYNTLTGVFTVVPNFETAVSTDTTYDILLPEGMTLGVLQSLNGGLTRAADCISRFTVTTGATTTSIPTSAILPAASVQDQFKGLILAFDQNTSTAALRGQKTDITASTSGGTLTVTALTTAPASGDTGVIE